MHRFTGPDHIYITQNYVTVTVQLATCPMSASNGQVSTHVRRIRRTTCSKSNATPSRPHQRGGTAEPRHTLRARRQRSRSLRFIMGFPDDALARCSSSHFRRACARLGQPPSSARAPTSPQRRADADRDATPRARTRSRRNRCITDSK